MDWARRAAELSHARRLHVGAVIVKDDTVISYGYNGMPAGWDNDCEDKIWMDYIASYIQSRKEYPFNFLPPERTNFKLQGRVILANAAKDKGY